MTESRDRPVRQYWQERTESVSKKLDELLTQETQKKGLPFKNMSQAAKFAAQELTKAFPDKQKPFNQTTLTRNDLYREIIKGHIAKKEKEGEVSESERLRYKLELRKKDQENEELRKQLSKTLEERSQVEHRLTQGANHDAASRAVEASFGTWLTVLRKLLAQLEGAEIDMQRRTIEDPLGEGTIIKEKDFPEGFFEWLERNRE